MVKGTGIKTLFGNKIRNVLFQSGDVGGGE